SDTLAEISADAERLWWRLVVQADDYGLFDGRPNVVLGKCLTAFVGRISDEQVAGWLDELASAGLIRFYGFDGRPYIELVKWKEHQRPARAKEPKYPHPDTDDGTCPHMTASAVSKVTHSSENNIQTSEQVPAFDGTCQHMSADAPVVGIRSRDS